MLIIQMLMKITGFTQEEFANYVGVSRATVNYWLKGEEMSSTSKRMISEKFCFPTSFFDVSLDENIEVYKIIYSTLYKNWISSNENSNEDKITKILNELEYDEKTINIRSIDENDIIDGLCNGYNPFTGEVYNDDHILNNPEVKNTLVKIRNKYFKISKDIEYADLSSKQKRMYDILKEWRMNKTEEEGFFSAYMVFTNSELINIICANIVNKEDLLSVKGIGNIKYSKYADDLFEILKES